ncbi:hypothetical protein [Acinetobacter modestus]|uniref:hypothetical protein n=1 Tax=Acinetobacter modestus TaxID=1776740 RepID=UPI001F4B3363|nr:hypothetical protein [Acinetobacter modestus]MCH7334584.1 hypothetical protein [Acinetobacter modestus]
MNELLQPFLSEYPEHGSGHTGAVLVWVHENSTYVKVYAQAICDSNNTNIPNH